MKRNKKLVALATAGALTALTAVPAMAFENEFHGLFNLDYILSNYENGGTGRIEPTAAVNGNNLTAAGKSQASRNLKMNNYFEQRARIFYTAKANDDLKLVTAFEIDSVWGDKAQGSLTSSNSNATAGTTTAAFRNSGGALESDAVNLETKWVYLQFKIPATTTTLKAGIQPFKDQIKGVFADFDGAGLATSTKLGNAATLNASYFRGYDQSFFSTGNPQNTALTRGNQNLDLGAVEFIYQPAKDVKVSADYYIYGDGRPFYTSQDAGSTPVDSSTMVHTFALTGETKIGPATVSGFGAYQYGVLRGFNNALGNPKDTATLNAVAYNLAAKAPIGPGTLKTALLFTSGNDDNASRQKSNHLTGWFSMNQSPDATIAANATNSYNESGMILLNRNNLNVNTSTDQHIIMNTNNGTNVVNGQGMYLYTVGYDATITPKLYTNVNAGFAWAAHSNVLKPIDRVTGKANSTNFMGTEVNIETGYKLYDNLTAKVQAAYVVLGGYYANSLYKSGTSGPATDPENPYTGRIILSYVF